MAEPPTRAQRREWQRLAGLLSDQLDAWDPLGVYQDADDAPPGEYDCLAWPVLRLLRAGAGAGAVGEFLDRRLVEHLGLTAGAGAAIAPALVDWWAEASRPAG